MTAMPNADIAADQPVTLQWPDQTTADVILTYRHGRDKIYIVTRQSDGRHRLYRPCGNLLLETGKLPDLDETYDGWQVETQEGIHIFRTPDAGPSYITTPTDSTVRPLIVSGPNVYTYDTTEPSRIRLGLVLDEVLEWNVSSLVRLTADTATAMAAMQHSENRMKYRFLHAIASAVDAMIVRAAELSADRDPMQGGVWARLPRHATSAASLVAQQLAQYGNASVAERVATDAYRELVLEMQARLLDIFLEERECRHLPRQGPS